MSAAMKLLRATVFGRAMGCCESCNRPMMDGHLDHFFGRAKADGTPENCWALCMHCDHEKTNNRPSAGHWHLVFARRCARWFAEGRLEYQQPMERALTKLAVQKLKGFA